MQKNTFHRKTTKQFFLRKATKKEKFTECLEWHYVSFIYTSRSNLDSGMTMMMVDGGYDVVDEEDEDGDDATTAVPRHIQFS